MRSGVVVRRSFAATCKAAVWVCIEEGAEPEGNELPYFVLAIERCERRRPTRVGITTTAHGHKGIKVPPKHDVWCRHRKEL